MENQSQGALPRRENERIFQERIIPRLESADGAALSRAWVLGGQPGAGKSSLLGRNSSTEQGVPISKDSLRVEHPDWLELLEADHETASSLTSVDATIWAFKSIDWLIDKKRNIIMDGTLRNPEHAAALVRTLKSAHYRVKVHFVATPRAVSLMSVIERYWRNFKETDVPFRVCRRKFYEVGCDGVLETARFLDHQIIPADALHVYCRRTGQDIYAHDASMAHSVGSAAREIRAEQGRIWSPDETKDFLAKYRTLRRDLVETDEKWNQWFDDVELLARPVMSIGFDFPEEGQPLRHSA